MMELPDKNVLVTTVVIVLLFSAKFGDSQEIIRQEYHIEEESGVGKLVGNAGKDSGLYNKLREDVHLLMFQPFAQGNEYISYFSVNTSNGVIRTAKNIDRETLCPDLPMCSVKLNIAVYRRSLTSESPKLMNILEVVIIIDDINDNSPTFPSRVVNLPLPENLDVNYQVETSVATDADEEGVNSRITYRLEPPSDMFELSTVKTTDGVEDLVITIKRVLDREEKTMYPLMVVATDLGDEPRSGTVLINIQVTDMNDNAPVFGRLNYSVNILENSDISVPVVIVTASDRDERENARLSFSFSFQVSQEIRETFTVEPNTGKIFSTKELDFETKQFYQFYVVVSDHGSPSRSNFAYVTINVIDINDNAPLIQINSAPGGDFVVEHGSVGKFLAYIKVSDADSQDYGLVSCDIEDPHFVLEAVDKANLGIYKIKLKHTLDKEEAATRDVVIMCKDGDLRSPMSASASFTITVEDINDNPPQLLDNFLIGSVLENGNSDAYVLQVVATDPDEGDNSQVTFAITSGSDVSLFSINENTGVISTTRNLDREIKSQYLLEVTASDHGVYMLASSATVTIKVLDENDNPPKFKKQAFFSSIMENLPAGSPSGDLSAHDLDAGENARFLFSILDDEIGSEDGLFFTVDSNTGLLKSAITFNREEKSVYKFRVKVADPIVASYYDIANVTVNINDDNDHIPFVVKPPPTNRTFRCPFNMTVGEIITTFYATDEDDPKLVKISYQIQDKNHHSQKWPLFSIEPTSGRLRLARQIRPDDVYTHTLEVIVKDGPGMMSQSSIVTISVIVEEGSEEAMRDFIDGSRINMVIIIIILAGTLILAFIIIAIIYLIKRMDKKRHRQLPSEPADGNSKLYHAAKWVSSVSVRKDSVPEEDGSILEVPVEKKKKKGVSFSLDDAVAGWPDANGLLGNRISPPLNTVHIKDGLPFQMNTHQIDFIVMNGMTTPDYSQHLYDAAASSGDHQEEHQFMEVRQADDRYSDASSGDTGTSDSGRGGSEDEGHGHNNSAGDGDIRKSGTSGSLTRGSNILLKTSSKINNDTNCLQRLPHQQSSTTDSDDVPGSPTPLLSDRERKVSSRGCIRRSYDKLPARRLESPSSSRSSPSPSLTNQTSVNPRKPHYNSEFSMLSRGDSEGTYSSIKTEQQNQLLQTFSSPHASGVSHYGSHPTWRKVKRLDTSWRPTPTNYKHDDNEISSDSYTVTSINLKDIHSPDVLV